MPESFIGGIVGSIRPAEIIDCRNKGNSAGGIVGKAYYGKSSIINCINEGKCTNGIITEFASGNWVNEIELNIKNSYNLGEVSNSGIIGTQGNLCKMTTLNIENCYNAGKSTYGIIGKIANHINTTTITNIKNTYYDNSKVTNIGAIEDGITAINIQNNNSFVETLNSNIGDNVDIWKKWKLGEDGYPTFE